MESRRQNNDNKAIKEVKSFLMMLEITFLMKKLLLFKGKRARR